MIAAIYARKSADQTVASDAPQSLTDPRTSRSDPGDGDGPRGGGVIPVPRMVPATVQNGASARMTVQRAK